MTTSDAHAGAEESRVPLASVAPYPTRMGCLEFAHGIGEAVGRDKGDGLARSVGIDESDETSLTR